MARGYPSRPMAPDEIDGPPQEATEGDRARRAVALGLALGLVLRILSANRRRPGD